MDVTTAQAAQLLGVTRRAVQKYVSSGKLKFKRYGLRMVMINLDELRQFAQKNNMFFDENLAKQLEQAAQ